MMALSQTHLLILKILFHTPIYHSKFNESSLVHICECCDLQVLMPFTIGIKEVTVVVIDNFRAHFHVTYRVNVS